MGAQDGGKRGRPATPRGAHQPSGGATGQATDIDIHAREILILRRRLNELMAGDESAADIDEYQSDLPEGYYDNFAPDTADYGDGDIWGGASEEEKALIKKALTEAMS